MTVFMLVGVYVSMWYGVQWFVRARDMNRPTQTNHYTEQMK